jgi:hypothetical protein
MEEIAHNVAYLSREDRLCYFDLKGVDEFVRKEVAALPQFNSPLSTTPDRDIHQVVQGARPHGTPNLRATP